MNITVRKLSDFLVGMLLALFCFISCAQMANINNIINTPSCYTSHRFALLEILCRLLYYIAK
uniref:Uncharacterized protein n=1 Tax=Arundo donax TaxID=35708 RepID=A0A0A8XQB9_ARUDO